MKSVLIFIYMTAPGFSFATTLIELGTAVGLSNTVSSGGMEAGKKNIEKARQAVQQHEETQQKHIGNLDTENAPMSYNPPLESLPQNMEITSQDNMMTVAPQNSKEPLTQSAETTKEIPFVDYTRDMQVFYKKHCEKHVKNCDRGPVLTNIKSVIFNYAHTRGSFSAKN